MNAKEFDKIVDNEIECREATDIHKIIIGIRTALIHRGVIEKPKTKYEQALELLDRKMLLRKDTDSIGELFQRAEENRHKQIDIIDLLIEHIKETKGGE